MEPIDAVFDGIPATVQAVAHGTDPGTVVLAIGGPLGGGLELKRPGDARRLMYQLSCAFTKASALEAEAAEQGQAYAHA